MNGVIDGFIASFRERENDDQKSSRGCYFFGCQEGVSAEVAECMCVWNPVRNASYLSRSHTHAAQSTRCVACLCLREQASYMLDVDDVVVFWGITSQ